MIIRLLLIAAVVGISLVLFRGRGSAQQLALRRLAGAAFAVSWILAVIFPDVVTWIATAVGVGRGTDLLLYILVVAVALLAVSLYQRLFRLEERLAAVVRELAMRDAAASPGRAAVPDRESHEG